MRVAKLISMLLVGAALASGGFARERAAPLDSIAGFELRLLDRKFPIQITAGGKTEEHGAPARGSSGLWARAVGSRGLGGAGGRGLRRLRLVADALEARRGLEANATLGPLLEFGGDIFGDEDHLSGTADELILFGVGFGSDERENGRAIGR